MDTHVAPPSGRLTAEEFLDFIADRPREERWQLVDGDAFVMMSPATLPHLLTGRMHVHRGQMAFPEIPRF